MTATPAWLDTAAPQRPVRLGMRTFPAAERVVMAIINRTPDSFYHPGATYSAAAALAAAERALDAGAAIVDIGGVKAGVGPPVSPRQEIERVVPVIGMLRDGRPEAVISVDTWRAEVAQEAVAAGADLINDAWQGHDRALADVAATTGVGLVCAHAGHLPPRADLDRPHYDDVVADVLATITSLAQRALRAGVRPDGLLIDPGHDFGKTTVHSLEVTRRLDELVATGWPVLVAVSNKDFIGETLDRDQGRRLDGSLAAEVICILQGARIVRVHDIPAAVDAVRLTEAVLGFRQPAYVRHNLD